MNLKEAVSILKSISKIFKENSIRWCLGSSSSLMVQNVSIEPHDLDIIVNIKDFDKVYKLFISIKKFQPSRPQVGKFKDVIFKKFSLDTVIPTEVVGFDLTNDVLKEVHWNEITIPVHPLEFELEIYKSRVGKENIVDLIEDALIKKNTTYATNQ